MKVNRRGNATNHKVDEFLTWLTPYPECGVGSTGLTTAEEDIVLTSYSEAQYVQLNIRPSRMCKYINLQKFEGGCQSS